MSDEEELDCEDPNDVDSLYETSEPRESDEFDGIDPHVGTILCTYP